MTFDDFFSNEVIIKATWDGKPTTHYLRDPTAFEDLEFRRKLANVKVRNREIQTSDAALNAPIQLYDKICQRVIYEDGAGPEEVAPEDIKRIPRLLKADVIAKWQRRCEIDESEVLGN